LTVVDAIHNAIVSNPETPEISISFQFFYARRTWFLSEQLNGNGYSSLYIMGK